MLDTILLAGQESARSFDLGMVMDLEHPFPAALDLATPAIVVPTDSGPPAAGATGWFFHLDCPTVAVTRVSPSTTVEDGRGWGLTFHLLETAGRAVRGRLRLFRNPAWARLIDFNGETIVDLTVEGDAVQIDLTPHELAIVDITLA
jgi:alpha-mannosidase